MFNDFWNKKFYNFFLKKVEEMEFVYNKFINMSCDSGIQSHGHRIKCNVFVSILNIYISQNILKIEILFQKVYRTH